MKLPIKIEYGNGETETYIAQPPEWAKWERETGNIISQAQEKIGISDVLFLAYHAMKRSTTKPIKPFEAWCDGVVDVTVGVNDPKDTSGAA